MAAVVVGSMATALAAPASAQPGLVDRGRALYADGCQSCHGPAGEGVEGTGRAIGAGRTQGAGPPLRGVGAASVDLYLTTGYMPIDDPREAPRPSEPAYDREEIDAIVAYVESLGGEPAGPPIPDVRPQRGDVAEGFGLFAEHCAGCHQIAIQGGVVLDGIAPALTDSTPTQVGEAIRVGPYLMPRFGEAQISASEVDSLARYIEESKHPRDEGGWGIGHIGPVPEGLVAWLVAGVVLVGVARVIGRRLA